ncbi:hypothetical protein ACSVBT_04825 [Afipia sp. TerB]
MTMDSQSGWEATLEAAKIAADRLNAARHLPPTHPEARAASAAFRNALDQLERAADQADSDASPIQPDLP